jgi:two-component system sensor kinase FixL
MQTMTVPHSIISHLFEAFRSNKRNGMGLSLTICRSIAEPHGGELRYEPIREAAQSFASPFRGSGQ